MALLLDADQQSLTTDPSIPVAVDGRQQNVIPFRLGMPPPPRPRPMHPPPALQPPAPLPAPLTPSGGTPVSTQQQLKKMPPPVAVPQMRISSNGGMRPPPTSSANVPLLHSSPPNQAAPSQLPLPATNGINRAAINISHVDVAKPDVMTSHSVMNGAGQAHASDISQSQDVKANVINGSPGKQSVLHSALPVNGYNFAHLAGQHSSAAALAQIALGGSSVLTAQQVQSLKSALANNGGQDFSALQNVARSLPSAYLQVPGAANFNVQQLAAGANMNIKLPAARQMQWAGVPKPGVLPNGVANGVDTTASTVGLAVPVRVPSANGTRSSGIRIPSNGQLPAHVMSPQSNHTPSPVLPANAALGQAQSPSRVQLTPTMTKASPSLQHQQSSNSKSGY